MFPLYFLSLKCQTSHVTMNIYLYNVFILQYFIITALTGVTPSHFCACLIPRPAFPMPYVRNFYMFNGNGLRRVAIVRFVDINEIF